MTDSNLLDSSVWISFVINNEYNEIINSNKKLYISTLSLFEIKRKFLKDGVEKAMIYKIIEGIKSKCSILEVTSKIAESAAEIAIEKNMPSIDSVIYTTAKVHNLVVLTRDNDFRGLDGVTIL